MPAGCSQRIVLVASTCTHIPQEEEGDVRVSAVSVARPATVSGSDGKLVKRRADATNHASAWRAQCNRPRPLLLRRTGHVYHDYTPGLAGRLAQDGSCAPAAAARLSNIVIRPRRLTTCAMMCDRHPPAQCYSSSAPASGNSPLLGLISSRRPFAMVAGVAYSYSTRHISNSPALPAPRHRETSSSTGRPPTTARAETCATEHGLQPAWPRCGQPLSGTCCRRRDRPCVTTKCAIWECIDA